MNFDLVTRKLSLSALTVGTLGVSMLLTGCKADYYMYRAVSGSMSPLIRTDDRILIDQSDRARIDLHDGDVILLRRPDAVVLKRILAMPGETISGTDRKIFRNGKQVDEPYLAPVKAGDVPIETTFVPRTVAAGELFVLGDNRDHSLDSRAEEYGPVRLSDVLGKYHWTYWHGLNDEKN